LAVRVALAPVLTRLNPAPAERIVHIAALQRPQWPGLLSRMGIVSVLVSFVLLLAVIRWSPLEP
jgi:hypothetical protein